jgi:predicted RNA-binding protein with PUA-like domain
MSFWLVKSEPSDYSFQDLVRDGRTRWDGVRNAQALINLRSMRKGDEVLVYHTGGEKRIVGTARVVSDPVPSGEDARLVAVDLAAGKAFRTPIPLAALRGRRDLAALQLLRNSRLSVMPVTPAEWRILLAISH